MAAVLGRGASNTESLPLAGCFPPSCGPAATAPRGGCTILQEVAVPPGHTTSRRLVSARRASTGLPARSGHLRDTEVMARMH